MTELEKRINKINTLDASEAKALLKIICAKMDLLKQSDKNFDNNPLAKEIHSLIDDLPIE